MAPTGSVGAIDAIETTAAAADLLYGLAPDRFVAERTALVKRLRAAGHREVAAEVGRLRRPTVVAAALNQVLRARPDDLEALLAAADDLRLGHQQVLEGESVDVAGRQQLHRQRAAALAATLVDEAERHRTEVTAALESATLDPGLHGDLRAAAFATLPSPATGFDLFAPTATVRSLSEARARRQARLRSDPTPEPGPGSASTPDDTPSPPAPPTPAEANEQRDREDRRREQGLVLADRRVEATTALRDKARARVDALAAQLEAARAHLDEAEQRVSAALEARNRLDRGQPEGDGPDHPAHEDR